MKSRNLVSKVLGLTTTLVTALASCKTPEQNAYENTYLGVQYDGSFNYPTNKIAVSTEYSRGIDMIQIYGDNGNLLFTDNLNDHGDNLIPGGHHLDTNQEFDDKKLTVRVFSPDGHTFKKKFKNPKFDKDTAPIFGLGLN